MRPQPMRARPLRVPTGELASGLEAGRAAAVAGVGIGRAAAVAELGGSRAVAVAELGGSRAVAVAGLGYPLARALALAFPFAVAACSVPDVAYHAIDASALPPDAAAIDAPVDAPAIDAPPDAPPAPMVTHVDAPLRIATGDSVQIHISLHAPTSAPVAYTLAAMHGSVAPSTGQVDVDANDDATFSVTFTAAATAGDDVVTVTLDDGVAASSMFTAHVGTLVSVGNATSFGGDGGAVVSAEYLFGQQITIVQAAVVEKLGVILGAGPLHGRMALYLDNGANPATLVAQTDVLPLAAGTNTLAVTTPVLVQPGTYWLFGNFDNSADVFRGSTITVAHLPLDTTAPLPATTSGASTSSAASLNYFAELIP